MSKNMSLWNKVCITPPSHTKAVTFGRRFTSIGAQFQRKVATEQFGKYGATWGVKDTHYNIVRDADNKPILWTLDAVFWFPDGEFPISSDMDFYNSKGKVNEDARKKLLTDITTKALSFLGFNSDVFEGKFDDNKYVAQIKEETKYKSITFGLNELKNWKATIEAYLKDGMSGEEILSRITPNFSSVTPRTANIIKSLTIDNISKKIK